MNALRYIRQVKGLSQMELGKRSGIHNQKISMAERGWRELSKEDLKKIALVLRVSTKEFQCDR